MGAVAPTDATSTATSPLSGIFQRRLAQLVAERATADNAKEQARLKATMFKLFLDAVDLGLIDDAQEILRQVNQEPGNPAS
jgi:hypothetical protein